MTHAIFAPDGSALVLADVFGVTRFALRKAVKVKHGAKFSSFKGAISLSASGARCLVQGRVCKGVYGQSVTALASLPGLGLGESFHTGYNPHALVTVGDTDLIAGLDYNGLAVLAIEGDKLRELRRIDLAAKAARALDARAISAKVDAHSAQVLGVSPDGRFIARSTSDVFAGRIGPDDAGDEVWWRLPVEAHPCDEVTLTVVGDDSWIFVRDASADVVHALCVARDGGVREFTWASLCAPSVDGSVALTQPDSNTVVAVSLTDGSETRYDVTQWSAHPAPEPESSVYRNGPARFARRLAGLVAVRGASRFFVPWHREFVVDLAKSASHSRGLEAGSGPLRRLLLERYASINEATRDLRFEAQLSIFERHPRDPSVTLGAWMPHLPKTVTSNVADCFARSVHDRFEFRTHGIHMSSFGSEGGNPTDAGIASLDETRSLLAWMRRHGIVPADAAPHLSDAYDHGLGIPSAPQPNAFPFEGEAERMVIRATLETLISNGWTSNEIPDAWRTEPLTLELVQRLNAWLRERPRRIGWGVTQMLAKMLARHLDAESLPLNFALFEDFALHGEHGQNIRPFGEAITYVTNHHPELRESVLARIETCLTKLAPGATSERYEVELTRLSVARGAKHFWSNG